MNKKIVIKRLRINEIILITFLASSIIPFPGQTAWAEHSIESATGESATGVRIPEKRPTTGPGGDVRCMGFETCPPKDVNCMGLEICPPLSKPSQEREHHNDRGPVSGPVTCLGPGCPGAPRDPVHCLGPGCGNVVDREQATNAKDPEKSKDPKQNLGLVPNQFNTLKFLQLSSTVIPMQGIQTARFVGLSGDGSVTITGGSSGGRIPLIQWNSTTGNYSSRFVGTGSSYSAATFRLASGEEFVVMAVNHGGKLDIDNTPQPPGTNAIYLLNSSADQILAEINLPSSLRHATMRDFQLESNPQVPGTVLGVAYTMIDNPNSPRQNIPVAYTLRFDPLNPDPSQRIILVGGTQFASQITPNSTVTPLQGSAAIGSDGMGVVAIPNNWGGQTKISVLRFDPTTGKILNPAVALLNRTGETHYLKFVEASGGVQTFVVGTFGSNAPGNVSRVPAQITLLNFQENGGPPTVQSKSFGKGIGIEGVEKVMINGVIHFLVVGSVGVKGATKGFAAIFDKKLKLEYWNLFEGTKRVRAGAFDPNRNALYLVGDNGDDVVHIRLRLT